MTGKRVYLTEAEQQLIRDALVRHEIWTINFDDTPEEDRTENEADLKLILRIRGKI